MTPATPHNIELFLYEKRDWVTEEFLCSFWDVSERGLRRALAGVAFKGPRGWIHVHHAALDALTAYAAPKRAHYTGEYLNLRRLIRNHRTRYRPHGAGEPVATVQPELLP